jgi:hypothetical protein
MRSPRPIPAPWDEINDHGPIARSIHASVDDLIARSLCNFRTLILG